MNIEEERIKAFDEFVNQFKEENDRAAVILGASKIDYLLYQIINHFLIANCSKNDELLDGDSPLSTFSSRINMVFRLGIIDGQFSKALHLIRKIRNDFAHELNSSKLDTIPHRDRIRELKAMFIESDLFNEIKQSYFIEKPNVISDFFTVITLIVARLDRIFLVIKPLPSDSTFSLLPKKQNSNSPIKKIK